MYGLFSDEQRRKINLGGVSSAATHTSILDQAKARRHERTEQKRQQDNAVRIQAWWRGIAAVRAIRAQMKMKLKEEVHTITGLRCLVLLGQDEEALAYWSIAVAHGACSSLPAGCVAFSCPIQTSMSLYRNKIAGLYCYRESASDCLFLSRDRHSE